MLFKYVSAVDGVYSVYAIDVPIYYLVFMDIGKKRN